MLTVVKSSSGVANVTVTALFHRSLTTTDEQVFQASGADGVVTPFTVSTAAPSPLRKKEAFSSIYRLADGTGS